jgi:uncharacterized protein YndB with AHSA1/START domain
MTTQKSFKRLVRARMAKTGESYTAARASLLGPPSAAPERTVPDAPDAALFTIPDAAVRERTGRGWEAWLDVLDGWGAGDRSHGEIARRLRDEHGVDGWSAQAITVSYERARGLRAVGEAVDGFRVTVSKTVAVGRDRLFAAVVEDAERGRWLPGGELRVRTASAAKSARFDWRDGSTRVNMGFIAKADDKATVALSHERLADAAEVEQMRAFWRERLATLKALLEAPS